MGDFSLEIFKISDYSINVCRGSLLSPLRLFQIRSLLYQCYIVERAWVLDPENPSEIRTEIKPHPINDKMTNIFLDKFDNSENVYWFYAVNTESNEVCATTRIMKQDLKGYFEVDYYNTYVAGNSSRWENSEGPGHYNLAKIMESWRIANPNYTEVSRLCVDKKDRRTGVIVFMLIVIAECMQLQNFSFFSFTGEDVPSMIKKLSAMGGKIVPKVEFKFDPHDTNICHLIDYEHKRIIHSRPFMRAFLEKIGHENAHDVICTNLKKKLPKDMWASTTIISKL